MVTALRVTVVGAAGRSDLVVPVGARVDTLASAYAERLGLGSPPPMVTATGRRLDPGAAVGEAVADGDVVVAVDAGAELASTSGPGQPLSAPDGSVSAASVVRLGLGVAAAVGAVAVLAVAAHGAVAGPGWARPAVLCVLLLAAVSMVAARADARTTLIGPAVGATAAAAATWTSAPGGAVLAVAAGALGALVFAALARLQLPAELEDVSRTWLVGASVVATFAVAALLVGAAAVAVCAVLFAVAVSVVRLLPATVVDLPDDVLLDLDRLAVTAWSARERPRGGRRRHQVRMAMVRDVARRSSRAVSVAVALAAVLTAVTAPVVVSGDPDSTPWGHWGGVAMVAAGAGFLALVGRGFRSPAVRLVLGLTALWASGLVAVALVVEVGATGRWAAFAVAAAVGIPVLAAAVRLGRGWHSVWWARVGEVLETLTGVLVVALLPLATGLFDVVRVATGH